MKAKCFLRSGDKSRHGSKKCLCQSWQKFALIIYTVICFYAIKPYVRRFFCLFNRSHKGSFLLQTMEHSSTVPLRSPPFLPPKVRGSFPLTQLFFHNDIYQAACTVKLRSSSALLSELASRRKLTSV